MRTNKAKHAKRTESDTQKVSVTIKYKNWYTPTTKEEKKAESPTQTQVSQLFPAVNHAENLFSDDQLFLCLIIKSTDNNIPGIAYAIQNDLKSQLDCFITNKQQSHTHILQAFSRQTECEGEVYLFAIDQSKRNQLLNLSKDNIIALMGQHSNGKFKHWQRVFSQENQIIHVDRCIIDIDNSCCCIL